MDNEIKFVLEKIHKIRCDKGISIIELSLRSGLSHSHIFYIESKKKVPTLTTLIKIAKGLEVDLVDLFSHDLCE